jgi:hypothetical protein
MAKLRPPLSSRVYLKDVERDVIEGALNSYLAMDF